MDYLTIFLIAVVSYAIMVALTYVVFKASMESIKEAAEKSELCSVNSEKVAENGRDNKEDEPNSSLD
jgi:Na+-translocating ferredoxin:NAD+ oxidoreductase RnfG subunit